jgi:hypothetical protein
VLDPDPFSTEAFDLIPGIRVAAKRARRGDARRRRTAVDHHLRTPAARDSRAIVPIALVSCC